ncbi:MAG TPA: pentapeptide repeat-containing protein [Candidatus Nanoarchaeia archaeon]|nr:pentapeptide repeat-containing protein [Candidatus Nanoarchaeia archaeon]
MVTRLKDMGGREFISKILAGEKDFSGIRIEKGFDLHGYEIFEEMKRYLCGERLHINPIIIRDSEFRYIKAAGLYLPYTQGVGANFEGANLGGADFKEANLGGADFWRADLWRADFWRADLKGTNLGRADLGRANLVNVRNLEGSVNLGRAFFFKTRVRAREKEIIEEALKTRPLFEIVP